jgi:glycosyltransferase involved in cell wall biosynthesis
MRINWHTWSFDPCDGYGRQALNMLRALSNAGHDISPLTDEMLEMPVWAQRLAGVDWSGITISNVPGNSITSVPGRQWAFTMCEEDAVDPVWIKNINDHCERLLVPCPHNVQIFKGAGVTIPIHIVPLGLDAREYGPLPAAKRKRPYTFLAFADRGSRKGGSTALLGFGTAFSSSKYPDVRLIIKTRAGEKLPAFGDERITHWAEDCANAVDLYAQADCLVFPSKGEGWGLPPREAVALGIPAIVPRHTGLEVGIDCWATVILEKQTLEESGMGGSWLVPDWREVSEAMFWCYEHREEARQKAIAGGEWLRKEQTWDHAAQIVTALLEAHGGSH